MNTKPELIIFSQYLLGGGASFHRNMLANMPENNFDLKVIYYCPKNGDFAESTEFISRPNDVLFKIEQYEGLYSISKRLSKEISNKPGAIVANLAEELHSLYLFPRHNKTVYFICHDDGFLGLVRKFSQIIDVFIAHNIEVFNSINNMLPDRFNDVFFIPHGVSVQNFTKTPNTEEKLKIAFLARHHLLKGIYDLPHINQLLIKNNVDVDWMVMGDGPEKNQFMAVVSNLKNFTFTKPATNADVLNNLKQADIFILPSRKDGLPVAMLEAMSVGCVPVVSNFSEGIKGVIKNDIGYVLGVGDNASFANTIVRLDADRKHLNQLSVNAQNAIKQNFDIKIRAQEYFSLYSNFLSYKKSSTKKFNLFLKPKYILLSLKCVVYSKRLIAKVLFSYNTKDLKR